MPANVETMFYTDADGRNAPWHKMGKRVNEAPNSKEAIKVSGLDWLVKQEPAFIIINGQQVPSGDMVNYRASDNRILGTVSKRYKIVQNTEAFAFTDELLNDKDVDIHYETAGSLNGGRTVWLLVQLPDIKVLGDAVESYLLFSNSHDGSSPVKCNITNIRVVCQNTLNLAIRNARRSWTFTHVGDIKKKIEEARQTLALATDYNKKFIPHAEEMAKKKISAQDAENILKALFPIDDDCIGKVRLEHLAMLHENFRHCYNADDNANFKGTAWGMLNAFSDMIYHGGASFRKGADYSDRRLLTVINGNELFDKAHNLILAA